MDKDMIFQCRKCEHNLFADEITLEMIKKIAEYDCPHCGEQGYENWILVGVGNSELQVNEYNWH